MLNVVKWRVTTFSWTRKLSIVKTSVISKLSYRFNMIPGKMLSVFFFSTEIDRMKNHMEKDEPWSSPHIIYKNLLIMDHISKYRSFCSLKDTIKKIKRQTTV